MTRQSLKADFLASKAIASGDPRDALDAMLAIQQSAARARLEHPEPDWDSIDWPGPELEDPDTREEDAELAPDEPLTEREAITAAKFEEYETDRMWGREDD